MPKITNLVVISFFVLYTLGPLPSAHADILNLPTPGAMVNVSPIFDPALIKGLTVHRDNPFLFDFIVDPADSHLSGQALKDESDRMIKYFFAALTIPDKDIWVNLSPYEKDRMIPQSLGETAMGRDLLAQDYMLKQLTASLIYPQSALGKTFWDHVYAKAKEKYGSTQIPVNTFNKVWIVPQEARIYEHGQTAFILSAHLKVMLEEDYLSLTKHNAIASVSAAAQNDTHAIGSQVIRQIVLPEIEREVNNDKNFATLRQIFYAQTLAVWFKGNLKEALLNRVYANKSTVKGIDQNDEATNEAIFHQYLSAYKKGVFNFIKEDIDPVTNETLPRKYFSGGYATGRIVFDRSAAMTSDGMDSARRSETVEVLTANPAMPASMRKYLIAAATVVLGTLATSLIIKNGVLGAKTSIHNQHTPMVSQIRGPLSVAKKPVAAIFDPNTLIKAGFKDFGNGYFANQHYVAVTKANDEELLVDVQTFMAEDIKSFQFKADKNERMSFSTGKTIFGYTEDGEETLVDASEPEDISAYNKTAPKDLASSLKKYGFKETAAGSGLYVATQYGIKYAILEKNGVGKLLAMAFPEVESRIKEAHAQFIGIDEDNNPKFKEGPLKYSFRPGAFGVFENLDTGEQIKVPVVWKPNKPQTVQGFHIGGVNTNKGIDQLKRFNDMELVENAAREELPRELQSRKKNVLQVLKEQNSFVLGHGMTHQQMAQPLFYVLNLLNWTYGFSAPKDIKFRYDGNLYKVSASGEILGGTKAVFSSTPINPLSSLNRDITVTNLQNGARFTFNTTFLWDISGFGFYGGVDDMNGEEPIKLMRVFFPDKLSAKERKVSSTDYAMTFKRLSLPAGLLAATAVPTSPTSWGKKIPLTIRLHSHSNPNVHISSNPWDTGGVDLSQTNNALRVSRDANGGVKIDVNPLWVARVEREGIKEVDPIIIGMKPTDIQVLLGPVQATP